MKNKNVTVRPVMKNFNGPWKADLKASEVHYTVHDTFHMPVAFVFIAPGESQKSLDLVKLIEAAPDMFEAIELLMQIPCNRITTDARFVEFFNLAAAAFQKANGRT